MPCPARISRNSVSRRDLLLQLGSGFGSLAVAHLLSQDGLLAEPTVASAGGNTALNGGLHHRAKVNAWSNCS